MPRKREVLLVDDDDGIREVATMSLELVGGYTVRVAGSGEQAITMAQLDPPDVILLDVMMPGRDGPSTFAVLQEDPRTRDIPVILLTAKTQQADLLRFAELGVAGVLAKPFDPMSLPGEIAQLLGWTT